MMVGLEFVRGYVGNLPVLHAWDMLLKLIMRVVVGKEQCLEIAVYVCSTSLCVESNRWGVVILSSRFID